ncbi:MAG: glycosyltransferase family 4 protein [Chryseosolibacter sp.]
MTAGKKLKMGAILPHTKLFGGVKRFFELGRVFIGHGHEFFVFTPEGLRPDWYPDSCPVEKISNLDRYGLDALFITETNFLDDLIAANAILKIVYHVGPRVKLHTVLKHKEIVVFVNSSNMYDLDKRKYGILPVKALGGIDVPAVSKTYRKKGDPFTVMAYGRLSRKGKGTSLVVKACEKLYQKGYPVKLLLFDTPIDETSQERINNFRCKVPFEFVVNHPVNENNTLYGKADVFVAAEKKGGWSNTAAEALAAGVPLIGTATGTKDFLIHNETGLLVWRHAYFIRRAIEKYINNPELAERLARNGRQKIHAFNWEKLAAFIESYVVSRLVSKSLSQ